MKEQGDSTRRAEKVPENNVQDDQIQNNVKDVQIQNNVKDGQRTLQLCSRQHRCQVPSNRENPEGCRDDTGAVQGDEPAIQKRMPTVKKISRTVEIIHAVGQGLVPDIAKTDEIPQPPDIMKLVITETTDERSGADVDDGFATTGSELAVYSREREQAAP